MSLERFITIHMKIDITEKLSLTGAMYDRKLPNPRVTWVKFHTLTSYIARALLRVNIVEFYNIEPSLKFDHY